MAKFTEFKNKCMSKEKVELRKEVFIFMEKQGHELKLSLDGSPIPYGVVNHLIASFHEHKMEELSKLYQHDANRERELLRSYFKWHKEQGFVSHKDCDIDEFISNNRPNDYQMKKPKI